jgi:hypothetical protein
MDEEPINDDKATPTSLEGCNRLAIFAWGAIVAPIAVGLARGVAVVKNRQQWIRPI